MDYYALFHIHSSRYDNKIMYVHTHIYAHTWIYIYKNTCTYPIHKYIKILLRILTGKNTCTCTCMARYTCRKIHSMARLSELRLGILSTSSAFKLMTNEPNTGKTDQRSLSTGKGYL